MADVLSIDLSDLEYKLAQFVRKYPADARLLLRDQMRLLVNTLIKWTPPPNQKSGRAAITKDVGNLIAYTYTDNSELQGIFKEASTSKDGAAFRHWDDPLGMAVEKNGAVKIPLSRIDNTGEKILADHARSRNRRGRVHKSNYWITSRSVVKRRVLPVLFAHVGNLKKGWMRAAELVGAKIPDFALRSSSGPSGAASGSARQSFDDEATLTPEMEVANTTPYIRDEDNMIRRAIEMREADIAKHLPKRLEAIFAGLGMS